MGGTEWYGDFPAKSSVTLFTPWSAQVSKVLPVGINGELVPTDKNPKLLGLVLDPTFSFSAHSKAIARKAASRINLIRVLASTEFGKDMKTLMETYKLYIRFRLCSSLSLPQLF